MRMAQRTKKSKTKEDDFQYPNEKTIPMLYKFIYKYEVLNVKSLSDKQIKDFVQETSLADFDAAIVEIRKTGKCETPKNNSSINKLFNDYQRGKIPKAEYLFEKRTNSSSFLNNILYHLRNTFAHADFCEVGDFYKIIDYDGARMSAFGFIKKKDLLLLLRTFV